MPSIEAIDLSKKYGSFQALADLNLKIEGAKCVGFLGPNGAGKTTTLKIFTDMIRPTNGKALINEVNVHTEKRRALEHCGALIESPEIYPSFTPREALMMIAALKGMAPSETKQRIESVVTEVKMEEWIDKKVGKFSKGMKQRINIASALLSDPDIVLLDEPTTGLDPRGMSEVRDIVKALKKRNRLVFMSSHLLPEVSEVCDEVAMIDHGKLLVYDKIENVTNRFGGDGAGAVEAGFAKPIEDAAIARIRALPGVVSADRMDTRNLKIKFSGGNPAQERLLNDLASARLGMISFRSSTTALEETYLNLIKDTL